MLIGDTIYPGKIGEKETGITGEKPLGARARTYKQTQPMYDASPDIELGSGCFHYRAIPGSSCHSTRDEISVRACALLAQLFPSGRKACLNKQLQ